MGFLGDCAKWCFGGLLLLALQACGKESNSSPSDGGGGLGSGGQVGSGGSGGLGGLGARGGSGGSGGELGARGGSGGEPNAGAGTSGGSVAGGSAAVGRGGSGAGGSSTQGGASEGGEPANEAGAAGQVTAGDPLPVEPNLTGLVPHSTRWLLIGRPSSGTSYVKDIALLDLADNQVHAANPDGTINVIGTLSPDGRTYFFSNGDGSAPSERIIRLEPDGFVPAHQLEDYVGVRGAYQVLSWSFDSRFAVVSRGAGTSSVEIVDMRLGTRLATENFSSIIGAFAPKGYYYYYSAANKAGFEPKYARLTQSGSTPRLSLPPDAKQMVFDPDGTQLFYALGVYPATDRLFMISLADGNARELHVIEAGEILNAYEALPVAGNSVVVSVSNEARTSGERRRVFLDGKPSVTLTDPARYASRFEHSRDNNLYALIYTSKEFDLIRVEPYARKPLSAAWIPATYPDNIGFIGGYAYLGSSDGLHLARFDDAGEVNDQILGSGKAARACASDFSYTPLHKLAFLQGDGEALVFVDLDESPPTIRASVQPSQAGFKLTCPVWGDNDTALAFTESDGTTSNTYVTRWIAASPESPVLAGTNLGKVYAVMYR